MKKIVTLIIAIVTLCGCEKNNIGLKVNSQEVIMYSLDEHVITTDGTNVSFSSQNPYVAEVNETTGKITARHIGETLIDVFADQGTNQVKVTVWPKYNVIKDPFIEWGVSMSAIQKSCGAADEINDGDLYYFYGDEKDGDKHIGTVYMLEDDRLNGIMVILNNKYYDDAALHLAERFQYIGYEDGMYVYMDAMKEEDVKTIISLFKTSGRWIVMYIPHK